MKIPFLDLEQQYESIKSEIKESINNVLDNRNFINGPETKSFEKNFLEVHGAKYGKGCSNGTSAITIALRSLNIGPGDEVITATNTFFATIEAIAEVGAKIVLVDCDADTYSICPKHVQEVVNEKTKAIIPVHLYGNPCDMDAITKIANEHNLYIIEDCAQAHLASFKGQAVGTFGEAGSFSFYPGKNLGAYGDAGFTICNSPELEKKISMHINHGRTLKYEHEFLAGNYRIDEIQSAILNVKTKYIAEWTQKRIEAAKYYDSKLSDKFKVIKRLDDVKAVYHLYVIEVENRDKVLKSLKEAGISCGIHYPIPLHLQPACKQLGYKLGDFPVAEESSKRLLSIPIFPEITREQQDFVIENLLKI
ncbi:DegT/DnrJ/EryC1/StrS family aminotransferase [Halobacteriovorax sp.]|uniref:DegT/DnrJ/EryC1/StrS family aminotransferase n=1 Tax=Halobacteriovorax sp. TaxID=2020862 RepID=UPI003AF20ADD